MKLYVYNKALQLGHRGAVSQGEGKLNQLQMVRTSFSTVEISEAPKSGQKTLFINITIFGSFLFSFLNSTLLSLCAFLLPEVLNSARVHMEKLNSYIIYLPGEVLNSKQKKKKKRTLAL